MRRRPSYTPSPLCRPCWGNNRAHLFEFLPPKNEPECFPNMACKEKMPCNQTAFPSIFSPRRKVLGLGNRLVFLTLDTLGPLIITCTVFSILLYFVVVFSRGTNRREGSPVTCHHLPAGHAGETTGLICWWREWRQFPHTSRTRGETNTMHTAQENFIMSNKLGHSMDNENKLK